MKKLKITVDDKPAVVHRVGRSSCCIQKKNEQTQAIEFRFTDHRNTNSDCTN